MLRTPDGGQKPPAGKRQDGKGPEEKEKKGIVRSIYVKISLDKLYKILYNLSRRVFLKDILLASPLLRQAAKFDIIL